MARVPIQLNKVTKPGGQSVDGEELPDGTLRHVFLPDDRTTAAEVTQVGPVADGGTNVVLLAANPLRKKFMIRNTSDNATMSIVLDGDDADNAPSGLLITLEQFALPGAPSYKSLEAQTYKEERAVYTGEVRGYWNDDGPHSCIVAEWTGVEDEA